MKLIHKSYKFRINPTKEQIILISKHFGATRFVFNRYLNIKKQGLKILSCVSGTDSQLKQKRSKALPLGESMTSEAQPISYAVGG